MAMTMPALVVDTREQRAWSFPAGVPLVCRALPAGDYSIDGEETRVAIERKSLGDFVGSVTHDHDRFRRELLKLREYSFAAVVVEATLEDVAAKAYRSTILPARLLAIAATLAAKYVPVYFVGSRELAADWALRLLRSWWTHCRTEAA